MFLFDKGLICPFCLVELRWAKNLTRCPSCKVELPLQYVQDYYDHPPFFTGFWLGTIPVKRSFYQLLLLC